MLTSLTDHVRRVYALVEGSNDRQLQEADARIARSWRRCIQDYGLDPAAAREPLVLDRATLLERQERLSELLAIAKVEMTNLYQQIAGSGYAVLLTDRDGTVLNYIADPTLVDVTSRTGLTLGGVWNEQQQGTNGMGTCLMERKPLVVHHEDHFFARNVDLTCSAAPIFDPFGELQAVLDASSNSRDSKQAQQHTMVLVHMSAQMMENCLFLSRFRGHFVLRFHSRPEFVSILGEGILAFDGDGKILAANQSALYQIGIKSRDAIVGAPIGEIFNITLSGLVARASRHPSAVLPIHESRHGRRFFAMLQMPSVAPALCEGAPARGRTAAVAASSGPYRPSLDELEFGDARMTHNVRCAKRVMNAGIPILLHGETGTGKEVFARAVHMASERADRPFVALNCAAIPESLIESELFGYKHGAFTGARREGNRGKILQSSGGTLFLDEIGDMPLQLQTRLLRVLEEREIVPLGGENALAVDLHVISATHQSLEELIEQGRFREDLYYRLKGITLTLPALRERTDIGNVIRGILAQEAQDSDAHIEDDAFDLLRQYYWPGNIRQLRNVLRTALVLRTGSGVRLSDLPPEIVNAGNAPRRGAHAGSGAGEEDALASAERDALLRELERHRWNVSTTAASIGLSRNTLYRKMKKHGIFQPKAH
jgi:sigma-54 dependent transcriptional regulator, acetoin dehydrogenase operon transcriptional activator AcoR